MEITIIGAASIILSIYAFLKDEKLLLKFIMFFSVFTAAIAIDIKATTTPIYVFEIPMVLYIMKVFIYWFKNKDKIDFNNCIKNNRIFKLLIVFLLVVLIGEIYLYISKTHINYYDYQFLSKRSISFSVTNITQFLRLSFYILFTILLSFRLKDRKDVKEIINAFIYGGLFAIFWGFVQYLCYIFKIGYPTFLFNNNPYIGQGFNQFIGNFKRISSVSPEPSVLSMFLLTLIPMLYYKSKNNKIYVIFLILCLVCGFLTTSSTFYLGFSLLMLVFSAFFILNKNISRIKVFIKTIIVLLISIIISGALLMINYKITYDNNHKAAIVDKDKKHSDYNKIDYTELENNLNELAIGKIESGSGHERLNQEINGIELVKNNPLFGLGYGSIRTFTLFINVLANTGLIGLLIFLLFVFRCINKDINNKSNYLHMISFSMCAMLICFCISIPDLYYVHFLILLISSYCYKKESYNTNSTEKHDKRIRIGIDGRALTDKRAGIGTYTYEILKELNKIDNKNEYYIYSNKKIYIDFKLNNNFKIIEQKSRIGTFWLYNLLPKKLYQDNIDIFWGTQHVLPKRNEYTKNIKYVLTVHDVALLKIKNIGKWYNTIIQKKYVKKSCKSANKIITISDSTKKDLIELFNINSNKIKRVYLGTNFVITKLNSKEEKEIEERYKLKNKKIIFFLSTIEPRKNVITLIKSFDLFREKHNDYKLVLSGGLGWKYHKILKEIENSKYKNDIIQTGYISKQEKQYFYNNCEFFVYPSLYEGFGIPILEAFSYKSLVVTSNVSSIPEVGGKLAFYYNNVMDYKELEDSMEKVLSLSDTKKDKIKSEELKWVKGFTWEKCAHETLQIICEE